MSISASPAIQWFVNSCSNQKQTKKTHQSCVFVREMHLSLVDSPHKGSVMGKMLPCHDVITIGLLIDCRGFHYNDVIMGAMASQITSRTIVYSTVYSEADQRKHQSSASLAFVRGIHRGPVNSPHKMASNAENVSIWWRHHVAELYAMTHITVMTLCNYNMDSARCIFWDSCHQKLC